MAVTTGYVQRWSAAGTLVCVSVGPAPDSTELLTIVFSASDSDAVIRSKRTTANVLAHAQVTGREVEVGHPDDSGEIETVRTRACDVADFPLQLDGIEVTQAIQDLALSVPLIAGKRTVVRLHLSFYSGAAPTVRGEIQIRRGPTDPPVTLASLNAVTLDAAHAGDLPFERSDVSRSLNFVLPSSHTVAGPLIISIARITDATTGASIALGCERRPTVWFHPSPPLRLRVLGMRYSQGNPPITHVPTNLDFALLFSWLQRAYPVAQIVGSQAIVDATTAAPFGCGDINAQIAAIRALDMSAGGDPRTHYYGLVSDGGFFMRGCAAGIPATPDPGTVASGPTGVASWGWDLDGSYGDWYGGHELGHTFGRLHPGFCGESQNDLANYPFPAGQLAATEASFFGFDVGDVNQGLPLVALPGTQWHDVMTYCTTQWLSVYTYGGIRQRLMAEERIGGGGGGSGGSGGRPDQRFPRTPPAAPLEGPGPTGIVVVNAIANVDLTSGEGRISFVNPVPNLPPSPLPEESRVALQVVGPARRVLHKYPVAVRMDSELRPDEAQRGLVDVTIPVAAGALAIELVIDGRVADKFEPAGAPPNVRSVRSLVTEGNALRLSLELDPTLTRGQSYSVQVSTDHGRTWQTLGVGLQQPSFTLDRGQFREGEVVQVRIVTTNGFSDRVVTCDPFRA